MQNEIKTKTVVSNGHAAAVFACAMKQFGITEARLRRFCWKNFRITAQRVSDVLSGNPGHLGRWTMFTVEEWRDDIIKRAWLAE